MNRLLPDCSQASLLQFVRQNHFVHRFQQARPETGMDAVSRAHDLLRQFVFGHVQSKTISRKDAKIAKKTSPLSLRTRSGRARSWKSSPVIGPLSGSWSRKTGVNRSRK